MAENEPEPAPGVLLIAQPMVHGQTFRRTVILLCEHNHEGSFGLILNRPLDVHLDLLPPDALDGVDSAVVQKLEPLLLEGSAA